MCSVLGGEQQHAACLRHGEAAQAGDAGGDGDSQVQSQERLAALGLTADDTNGLLAPQAGDEPSVLLGALGQTPCRLDRQQAHRRRPVVALVSAAGGVAQISRNSFSSICRASR